MENVYILLLLWLSKESFLLALCDSVANLRKVCFSHTKENAKEWKSITDKQKSLLPSTGYNGNLMFFYFNTSLFITK